MLPRPAQRVTLVVLLTWALAACGGSNVAVSTPVPALSTPQATSVAQNITIPQADTAATPSSAVPTSSAPAILPAATEQAVTETALTTAPTHQMATLPTSEGHVMLRLGPGSGSQQVGMSDGGPRSFRIGGDGTIRILDNANKRVLIFGEHGERGGVLPISEAADPVDFIINTKAEVYVLDRAAAQVLHYGRDNALIERIPVNPDVANAADGVMLTSDQDLYLVQNNLTYWALMYQGKLIAPELQRLTMHAGTISPRSPRAFHMEKQDDATQRVMVNLISGETLDSRSIALPESANFLNVDRAMNLYFYNFPDNEGATNPGELNVWRVQPTDEQGSNAQVVGGVRLQSNCQSLSWRTFYVDQAGAAWTMCVNDQGATFTRYNLLDSAGKALPDAATQPIAVSWQPGSKADLVKG